MPRGTTPLASTILILTACAHPAPAVCPTPGVAATPPTMPSGPAPAPIAPVQPAISGYDQPPKAVLDVLRAPSPPQPYTSPTHKTILLVSWVDYPSIAQVAEPFLRLAGVRVDPNTPRKHDTPGGFAARPVAAPRGLVQAATRAT